MVWRRSDTDSLVAMVTCKHTAEGRNIMRAKKINVPSSFSSTYQLLEPFGGRSGGVVVSDEQHLVEVLVSRRVGLRRPRQVLALRTPQMAELLGEKNVIRNVGEQTAVIPASAGSCVSRPTFGKTPVRPCSEG